MKKIITLCVCAAALSVNAADLTTFSAGDPILASEINTNFSELESRIAQNEAAISADKAGLNGEPFNYSVGSSGFALGAGYTYYITDIRLVGGFDNIACTSFTAIPAGGLFTASSGILYTLFAEVSASDTRCITTPSSVSLNTPLKVDGGETLNASLQNGVWGVRVIGFRVAD